LTQNFIASIVTLVAMTCAFAGIALADDNARGEELYSLCSQCHGDAGEGMKMALAPAIAGLDQWYVESQLKVFRSGARGTHPGDVGGMRMHPMSRWLTKVEDITAVASFVGAMPATNPVPVLKGGDSAKGSQLYATCAACHGQQGEGNQSMNAPPLAGSSDWYLYESLAKYKAGIRGGNPSNNNAVLMRGMSNLLADDQAIKDVVAHITTLSR
jgi:cytochrome c oxidase subunit 2